MPDIDNKRNYSIIMIRKIKKQLGHVKRGIQGFVQDKTEKAPLIPSSLQSCSIGESVKKQKIECYKVGDGAIKILYVSCIHGNEVGTANLAHHLLNWADNHLNQLAKHSLYVIPCLNPDGFEQARKNPDYFKGGKIGRFNTNNVDLNRNFDVPSFKRKSIWSFGKNYAENVEVFCGDRGNSEPEIKALTKLIKDKGIRILFMFHNAGNDVMGNGNELSQMLTKIYSKTAGFRHISDEDWAVLKQTGTAKEWCDLHNIAYIEVEGSTRWGSDWKRQKKAIIATILAMIEMNNKNNLGK